MGIMTIDLRHFRCFVEVAEELHFHRAAKKLGVAQPALSRTIKTLERELGVVLLERSNRRVELTKAGKSFLIGCRECLGLSRKIIEDAQRIQQGKIGTLRIAYTENAMNGRLPSLLKAFKAQSPDIALQLTHLVTSHQLSQLADGTIDVGFLTGSVSRAGFDFVRIQSERFVCVVYEGHRFASRSSVRLVDLIDEPMIQGSKAHWQHYYSYLAPLFRNAGFEPTIAQEGLATSEIQRLVACGIGIALLTETVVDCLPPGLVVIPLEDVQDRLDTISVWQSISNNETKDHFVSFLKTSMLGET